jgi:hypothetical protein
LCNVGHMAQDPRFALKQFIAALEKHFEAVASARGPEDSSVEQAYSQLGDAFLNYQEAFEETYEDALPLEYFDDEE